MFTSHHLEEYQWQDVSYAAPLIQIQALTVIVNSTNVGYVVNAIMAVNGGV